MKRRADRKGPKSNDGFGDLNLKRKKDAGKKFKPKKSIKSFSAGKSKKMGTKSKEAPGKKTAKPQKRKLEEADGDKKEEVGM